MTVKTKVTKQTISNRPNILFFYIFIIGCFFKVSAYKFKIALIKTVVSLDLIYNVTNLFYINKIIETVLILCSLDKLPAKERTEPDATVASPISKTKSEEIWRGVINMIDVAQISITAHEVSGKILGHVQNVPDY
jgi:hypothetical protein